MENVSRQNGTGRLGWSSDTSPGLRGASEKFDCRILLVSESATDATAVSTLLSDPHHRFLRAKSVEETVALVSNGSADLVLACGALQDLDAIDLCRVLKRSSATRYCPCSFFGLRKIRMRK